MYVTERAVCEQQSAGAAKSFPQSVRVKLRAELIPEEIHFKSLPVTSMDLSFDDGLFGDNADGGVGDTELLSERASIYDGVRCCCDVFALEIIMPVSYMSS